MNDGRQMKYCCLNNEREGSCYFEFRKGKQDDWNFWSDDSLYVHADLVDELHIGELWQQAILHFRYYGVTIISLEDWQEVKRLSVELDAEAQGAISEMDDWLQDCFLTESCFTLLGI